MASRASSPARRPTNVTLDPRAVAEARELGINVSKACEQGLVSELKKVREARWVTENLPKIEAWNEWVEKNGLPLAHLRQF
jgi:antitoxin CcdA